MTDTFFKDPADQLDFAREWADWLQSGDAIASAAWTVPAGLTDMALSSIVGTKTIVWLSGGTAGERYQVSCKITTDDARVCERSILIVCREM